MSAISLVNLAERLLNQGSTQGQDLGGTQKTGIPQASQTTGGAAGDQFTLSSQNGQAQTAAQDAGLFSVTQFSFFSAAADLLLGQGAAQQPVANAAGNGAPAGGNGQTTAVLTALAGANPVQTVLNNAGALGADNGTNVGNAVNTGATATAPTTQAQATTGANGTGGTNGTTAAAGSPTVQQQIQSLNTSLAALGLTPQEIQQVDQVASVVNDFNPAAFTALAYQLEQLAQAQPGPATTGTTNTNTPAAGANGTGTTNAADTNVAVGDGATTNGAANTDGFQVQELFIKFTGAQLQAAATNGGAAQGAGNGNTNVQAAAFNLQIEEVNLTLTNGNGQTAQVQVPGTNANANGGPPKARAAGA